MSKIDELKAEVEKLPSEEFSQFFQWLAEKDWERWDQEIEKDSNAGRLDFRCVRPTGKRPGVLSRTSEMHRTTDRFWTSFARLPTEVQELPAKTSIL